MIILYLFSPRSKMGLKMCSVTRCIDLKLIRITETSQSEYYDVLYLLDVYKATFFF